MNIYVDARKMTKHFCGELTHFEVRSKGVTSSWRRRRRRRHQHKCLLLFFVSLQTITLNYTRNAFVCCSTFSALELIQFLNVGTENDHFLSFFIHSCTIEIGSPPSAKRIIRTAINTQLPIVHTYVRSTILKHHRLHCLHRYRYAETNRPNKIMASHRLPSLR